MMWFIILSKGIQIYLKENKEDNEIEHDEGGEG